MSKARSEYRILVVDDQKSMRGLATYFLKQIEFQDIDEAENAREASQLRHSAAMAQREKALFTTMTRDRERQARLDVLARTPKPGD